MIRQVTEHTHLPDGDGLVSAEPSPEGTERLPELLGDAAFDGGHSN